jgi:hypothetical protein
MRTLLLVVLASGIAHAEPADEPRAPRNWHLGIEGMTDFPLTVGAQVWAELPYRLRITMSSGELPDSYLKTINAIAVAAGAYNQSQADLITELLDRAATWRLHFGWRPFPRLGGYFEGGFGIVTLEKGLALADVIQLATRFTVPQDARIGLGYEVTTVVETLGIEVGWIWYPWRGLTIRVALAFAAAVGAQVSIEPNFASTVQRPFTQQAEKYAEDLIEKHFYIPTVGLALGWRLF